MAGKEQWLNPDGLDTLLEELRTKMDLLYAPINSIHKDIDTDSLIEQSVVLSQEYANEKIKSLRFSRPNLLHNWYFRNDVVIDQRNGYLVPPGVNYYRDSALTDLIDVTQKYYTVDRISSNYAQWTTLVDGTTVYSSINDVIRGYVQYDVPYINSIDRWRVHTGVLTFDENGFMIIENTDKTNARNIFYQMIDDKFAYAGETLTLSFLLKDINGTAKISVYATDYAINIYSNVINEDGIVSVTFNAPENIGSLSEFRVHIYLSAGGSCKVIAGKLEFGDYQTLAYQDDNGNWILYDKYDSQDQLIKCQKYQFELFNKNNTGQSYIGVMVAATAKTGHGTLYLPVQMRLGGNPILNTDCSADNPYRAQGTYSDGFNTGSSTKRITKLALYDFFGNGIHLYVEGINFVPGNAYLIWIDKSNTHQFLLDRNL